MPRHAAGGRLMDAWIAGGIFLVAYALIASERLDRTLVALLGGLLLIVLGVIDQRTAFAAIDLNVIFLLAGMMVLASALGRTGFFQWLAVHSVRLSRGDPLRLLIILCLVTAGLSAFLDNVTTVLLMTPVTLSVARRLGISAAPYLISQVLASNIGGTATLIGDPPNILIGSAAGLDFMDFLVNLGPVVLLILGAFLVTMVVMFRGTLQVPDHQREAALEATEDTIIRDRGLLVRTLIVVGLTIVGFLAHSALGLEAATIALLGATALMLVARLDPHEMLREVEWSTLFFFVGLFILVEAVVQAGIVGGIATDDRATRRRDTRAPPRWRSCGSRRARRRSSTTSPTPRPPSRSSTSSSRAGMPAGRALVVAGARRLPRWQPDHRRRVGERRRRQPRAPRRTPHPLRTVPALRRRSSSPSRWSSRASTSGSAT